MKGIRFSQAVVALLVMALATASAMAQYNVGFTWNREDDWVPGTTDHSSAGNPCTDSAGNPVWSAEYIRNVPAGSDLDTSDGVAPWYTLPSSGLMVWDSHWIGGTWARLYDRPPAIYSQGLVHITANQSYYGDSHPEVPLLRWQNPSAAPLEVSLTSGAGFLAWLKAGNPTGMIADVVVAWTDASDGDSVHPLYTESVVKTGALMDSPYVSLPALNIEGLVLDPGDDLLFSIRSRTNTVGWDGYNIQLLDNVTITVVPEPATVALLAVSGMALLRRRRRRQGAGYGRSEGCNLGRAARRVRSSQAIVALLVMALGTASAMAQYAPGFTWNRYDDWVPGTSNGSSAGNPCTDAAGNPVWSAEYILGVPAGSDLDSPNPWYKLPSSGMMVWDGHWSGGTWAELYDYPPTVLKVGLAHILNDQSYHGDHFANVPLLRWRNPSPAPLTVSLTSDPNFLGQMDAGVPTGAVVDIAIAWTDASDGDSVHPLYSTTIVKTFDTSLRERAVLSALAIDELALDPGDDIIFSVRSRTSLTGFEWKNVAFLDDVNITVVPEPATLVMLALGGMAMLGRRRRRQGAGQGQGEGGNRGTAARKIGSWQAVVALLAVGVATSSALAQYTPGFTWNRWDDWKPGTSSGSSAGNPCTDSAGNPAWSYEYIANVPAGSDLDDSDGVAPWCTLPSSGLMVWDGHTGDGAWGYQFDNAPFIFYGPYGPGHVPNNQSYHGDHFDIVPVVRWDNPSSVPLTVSLTSGPDFQGTIHMWPAGTTVDLAIARTDASDGNSVHLLYSQTIVKTLGAGLNEYISLPALDIENLALDPGDDILFSVRARAATTGYTWYSVMLNDDVTITVVPEPATMALLGLGGLALLRRRRARR